MIELEIIDESILTLEIIDTIVIKGCFISTDTVIVNNNKTLSLTDISTLQQIDSTNTITITIPLNSTVAFPIDTTIGIIQWNTGSVVIEEALGITMVSINGLTSWKISEKYGIAVLRKMATNTWLISGDIIST